MNNAKPRVFIASPLFNPPQIEIIHRIETLLENNGFPFYSARLHSGSAGMTAEQRNDPEAWVPVFRSNVEGLEECHMMIAVIEYALPRVSQNAAIPIAGEQQGMGIGIPYLVGNGGFTLRNVKTLIEVPDAGTVWEMGWFHRAGKPTVAFHTSGAKKLNLMMSHSCDGFIRGWDKLEQFLAGPTTVFDPRVVPTHFNWSAAAKVYGDEVE